MVIVLVGAIGAVTFVGEDERERPEEKKYGQRDRSDD